MPERFKQFLDFDTYRVIIAGIVGTGTAWFTDVEAAFRILVAAATFAYICLKIWKLIKRKGHK